MDGQYIIFERASCFGKKSRRKKKREKVTGELTNPKGNYFTPVAS
jgi:hypothetical protein